MTTPELQPLDFVYTGQRVNAKGERFVTLRTVNAKGELSDEKVFSYKKAHARNVGHLYRGAKFSAEQALGIGTAEWQSRWHKDEDIIEWCALESGALDTIKRRAMEANATAIDEIERLMLPLRRKYAELVKRYDMAGARALDCAVTKALMTPPRKTTEHSAS